MLELLGGNGRVVGIDIEIHPHNRKAIEEHPMRKRIDMIEASSVSDEAVEAVAGFANDCRCVMVVLDSLHTHDHALQELKLYSKFVNKGSYLVVLDTLIEDMPASLYHDRSWGPGNNPKTAVYEFLKENKRFVIDKEFESKLLLTVAPDGYLKCIEDSA